MLEFKRDRHATEAKQMSLRPMHNRTIPKTKQTEPNRTETLQFEERESILLCDSIDSFWYLCLGVFIASERCQQPPNQ